METETRGEELKHLGFVKKTAIRTVFLAWKLYDFAKQNSGPLKSPVGRVEGAVTAVVGPVWKKFKDVPDNLLGYLDKKVVDVAHKFDDCAPTSAKTVFSHANVLIQKASEKVQKLVDEAHTKGPKEAFEYAATEYRQFLLTETMKAWFLLDQVPTFHKVAEITMPFANRWLVKYNFVVKETSRKGYHFFSYLPLVPVDEIAKKYKHEAEKRGDPLSSVKDGLLADSI